MNVTRKALVVPIAALAAALVLSGSASAQDRGRERGSGDRQPSAPSQPQRGAGAVSRSREPRQQQAPESPRVQQQAPRQDAPRVQQQAPRQEPRVQNVPRVQQNAPQVQNERRQQGGAPRVAPERRGSYNSTPYRQQAPSRVAPQSRGYSGGAVPRSYQTQRGYSNRSYGYSRESFWPRLRSSFYAPRFFYSASLYRPYYDFRPRFRFGLGLAVGYPVAYPTWYDPYLSTAYGWYRPGVSYGGVSFDIQPTESEIFVDGDYVGVVQDYGPYSAPLTLPAGTHHIDLQADGFEPLSFDITVVPQQVIPYQGTLAR